MTRGAAIALAAVAACAHPHAGTTPRQVEVLLDDPIAQAGHVGALIDDFDVSPQRLVVLSDADHLYALGWGGVAPIAGLAGVDSFAYTPDGVLLAVRGDQLLYRDATGALATFAALPHRGMALAAGSGDALYLFDRASGAAPYGLYELTPGRRVALILRSPQPIDAVAAAGDRLWLASGGGVFEAAAGKRLRLLAHRDGAALRSVAADAQRVYVSDGAAVYAVTGDHLTLVTATAGGSLRVRAGALFVLDPAHHLFVRLAPR